jgi:cell division protein FtsZ
MISYSRDPHQVVSPSSVKIIGLGGAGTNMLERIALDGVEGAGLIALNTDIRTLGSCLAGEKIQLGTNLTKGLGTGGDPELGHQAVLEAGEQVRAAIKGCRIVFLCVGLGGGTGSGAAPIVTRIAREEGAFVVVFATMPFAFEGKRRRDQAETALNELAVLSNALVTFDNNRMGELVLAKQGIHDAFAAADHMICESIKAVLRLVIRPGLINVGLDDLMSALRTTRSRCLFGSGIAEGKDRAAKALRGALASPLLDQGALLKDAQTVLVHLCGGEDLTLFEIELMMQSLGKFVPEKAHVLFGAAIDPAMNNKLSLTLISALPEDTLAMAPRESLSHGDDNDNPLLDPSQGFTKTSIPAAKPVIKALPSTVSPPPKTRPSPAAAIPALFDDEQPFAEPALPAAAKPEPAASMFAELEETRTPEPAPEEKPAAVMVAEFIAVPEDDEEDLEQYLEAKPVPEEEDMISEAPDDDGVSEEEILNDKLDDFDLEAAGFSALPPKRPEGAKPWTTAMGPRDPDPAPELSLEPEPPKLKLGIKTSGTQSELSLDSTPRGRFEGENPNVFEGEDLDLPPFLRKKK